MNDKPEIKPKGITPLKHICMTIGELPSSYLETMTYYEMLIWFTKFLQERMIPALDNNALAVEELQHLFIELQNYVNDYFDNLDVQDEINNKLDQMLEDGVLEQIIEQYLISSAIWGFDSVSDMKNATNLIEGSYARTLGYYSANDGGESLYKITNIQSQTEHQESLNSGLYATLIIENEVNIKQLGAYGDGTHDDTNYIKQALSLYDNLYFPNGEYILNDIIAIENKTITGENAISSIINEKGYETVREGVIDITGSNTFKNITLEKSFSDINNPETKVCVIKDCHDSLFNNVRFISDGYLTGATIDLQSNNHRINFQNCYSKLRCVDENNNNARGGLWIRERDNDDTTSNINFDNCYIENTSLDEAVAVWNWRGVVKDVSFTNCYIYGTADNTAPHFTTMECNNLKVNNCTFIDLGVNTSIGTSKIASMVRGSGSGEQESFFNNCIFRVNATLSNGYSTNDKAHFINCYFENTLTASLGEGIYKGCEIVCAECTLGTAICYDTHFKFTNSTGISLSQSGAELYNCIFDGMNYPSGKLLFQTFINNPKFILKNVQFNGNLNYTWFITLEETASVSVFQIENTLVGDIYRENLITDGYMINCPCIKSPQTLTNVKTNNIFNINS